MQPVVQLKFLVVVAHMQDIANLVNYQGSVFRGNPLIGFPFH